MIESPSYVYIFRSLLLVTQSFASGMDPNAFISYLLAPKNIPQNVVAWNNTFVILYVRDVDMA